MPVGTHMFHIWLTALVHSYERELIYQLTNKGYAVAPADGIMPASLRNDKMAGVLIALRVEKSRTTPPTSFFPQEVYTDVQQILSKMKAKYYSLIISPYAMDATWSGGNFEIDVLDHRNYLN